MKIYIVRWYSSWCVTQHQPCLGNDNSLDLKDVAAYLCEYETNKIIRALGHKPGAFQYGDYLECDLK